MATTTRPPATTAPEPQPTSRRRGGARRFQGGSPLVYAVAFVVVCATLGPVLYGVLSGFRTNGQLTESPAALPDPWVFTNYTGVITNPSFWQYTLNSWSSRSSPPRSS